MSNSRRSFFGKLAVTIGAAAAAVVPSKLLGEEEIKKTVGQPTVSDAFPTVKDEPRYALSDLDCVPGEVCIEGRCVPVAGVYQREYLRTRNRPAYVDGTVWHYKDATQSPVFHIPKKAVNSYEEVGDKYLVKLTNPYGQNVRGVNLACPDGQTVYVGELKAEEVITIVGVPSPEMNQIRWYLKRDEEDLKFANKDTYEWGDFDEEYTIKEASKQRIVYSTKNPHPDRSFKGDVLDHKNMGIEHFANLGYANFED